MKKTLGILSTSILGASLMLGFAAADTVTCGVSNTGPGSTNTVTCTDQNSVNVTCDNNSVVEDNNTQTGNSGNASSSGNTSSGFTASGNVTGSNSATVTEGESCAPVATAAATTNAAAATTAAGGKGAAAPAKAVAALPSTGSDTAVVTATTAVAVLGGTLAASHFGLQAYRRRALR